MGDITPMDLRRVARVVAANYGDKGAVVISVNDGGVRIGTEGLTPDELRHSLCVAINYTFAFEDADEVLSDFLRLASQWRGRRFRPESVPPLEIGLRWSISQPYSP